ncbi:MAG: hypothetical protein PWR01_2831 [Clostridiales bacterium]|jgi:hypothetical protein|nr:hypothetical protein [Clostridiales bacterium]MDN5281758.1 hypothetical protein [Candidatus Ozemobacter sp.]
MKKEHIDLVWNSLEDFDKANITFGDFLEHLGKAMESASVSEAKTIGEVTRDLEFAIVSGSSKEVKRIMKDVKNQIRANLRSEGT